ncbi:MAG: hypothetical protein P4L33_20900 [Capsulimonadaceae bacterium]|nr:hypothetical protein [Capsulimonadaceae bacterium]
MIGIVKPVAGQVFQRHGFSSARAALNHPGGADLGYGVVSIVLSVCEISGGTWEYRVDPIGECELNVQDWRPLDVMIAGETGVANARVPAGGWRQITIRWGRNGNWLTETTTPPIAAGEIFLIAGDSVSHGQTRMPAPPCAASNRISVMDLASGKWHQDDDRQPSATWPVWHQTFDNLSTLARVPIGVIDVSRPATPAVAWRPGTQPYAKLKRAGECADRFRAVLWQTGLTDVECAIEADEYVRTMVTIRDSALKDWGFTPSWLIGTCTYGAGAADVTAQTGIRRAVQMLCKTPGFESGADLDLLDPECRLPPDGLGGLNSRGEDLASLAWFAAIWPLIAGR